MNKDQIIAKLESRWADFKKSFEGLNEDEMIKPGPAGGWSIKDILAHVATWEEEAFKNLPLIVEDKRLPRYNDLYGGINAFNTIMAEENHRLPLDEVIRWLEDTHRRLLDYLRGIPEEQFGSKTRFRRRLAADTYNHYPEHTDSILALRRM